MIVVTNEVDVSKYLWSKTWTSVQRLRIVNPVKEIKRGSTQSRQYTFKINFRKSQQEAGERRKTKSNIVVFLSTVSLACLSTDFNATLRPIGNLFGI